LWNADNNLDRIYKLTTDGTVVSSFNSPGTFPRGLAWQDYSPIVCSSDSDCGADGFIRTGYCSANDIYQAYITYTCNNPGTESSSCSYTETDQLKEDCGASGWTGSAYCSGDDVWQTYRANTCESDASGAVCVSDDTEQLKQNCADTCIAGSCVSVECYDDSDCGASGWVETPFCSGNDVYQTYRTYTCSSPGTTGSSCSTSDNSQLKESCAYKCENGACVNCIEVCNFGNCYEYCI